MIKANDLRIGNLVKDEDGKQFKIISIEEKYVWHDKNVFSGIDTINGIKLSSFNLNLLDFKLDDSLSTIVRFRKSMFSIDLKKNKWYLHGYRFYPNGIEYVHELQNLYYVLTGRELNTIDSPNKNELPITTKEQAETFMTLLNALPKFRTSS